MSSSKKKSGERKFPVMADPHGVAAASVAPKKSPSKSSASKVKATPRSGSAAAHRSPSRKSGSAAAHIASLATVTNLLGRPGLGDYDHVSEEELARELAGYALEEVFASSASAAARPTKTVKESLKSLAETSKEVASLTAAATRSPSPEHFKKIAASLAASTAIAADLTLISGAKAKLSSDYDVAENIIHDVFDIPPKLRCQMITQFLSDIHAEVVKRSGESKTFAGGTTRKLLNFIDASKPTSCAHHLTDKNFLVYLISVMKTLFDTSLFNKDTLDTTGRTSKLALENRYIILWNRVMNSTMGKAYVKKGGSRSKKYSQSQSKKRRSNRTRKI